MRLNPKGSNFRFLPHNMTLLIAYWYRSLIVASFFLVVGQANAQLISRPNLRFRHIGLAQGLSQNDVQAILQDRKGFVWFGTADGLNKYDGLKMVRIYKNSPLDSTSVTGSRVGALWEDRQGYIWVGSTEGLDRFDPKTEKFRHFPIGLPDAPNRRLGMVLALHEDRLGNIWVGTLGSGILKIDADRKVVRFFQHDPEEPRSVSNNSVYAIAEDERGDLWFGTGGGGLEHYEVANDKFIHHRHNPQDPTSLSSDLVSALAVAPDGKIWATTYNSGLNQFDPQTQTFTRFQSNPADPTSPASDQMESLLFGPDGRLWVCTNSGLDLMYQQLNGKTGFHHFRNSPADPSGLSSDATFAIAADQTGGFWVGTINGGANYFHPNTMRFVLYQHNPLQSTSLSYNVIRCIFEDRSGNLWVGTTKGGLNAATPAELSRGEFRHYRHQPQDPSSLSSDEVHTVFQDSRGNIWVGTNQVNHPGLNRFVPPKIPGGRGKFEHYDLSRGQPVLRASNVVRAIQEDREGNLWVGTLQGLLRVTWRAPGDCQIVAHKDAADRTLSATSIARDSKGIFYISTLNRGVVALDPITGKVLRIYDKPQNSASNFGLSENFVRGAYLENDSILWVGMNTNGLGRLNTITGKIERFNRSNGLLENSVYGLQGDGQGNLWIGGGYGLTRFNLKTYQAQYFDEGDGLQSREFNTNAHALGHDGRVFFGGIKGFNAFYPSQVASASFSAPPPAIISSLLLFNRPFANYQSGVLTKNIAYADTLYLSYDSTNITLQFALPVFYAPEKHLFEYQMEGVDKSWLTTAAGYPGAAYSNLSAGHYVFRLRGIDQRGLRSQSQTVLHIVVKPPFWQQAWVLPCLILLSVGLGAYLSWRSRSRKQKLEYQVSERTELIFSQKEEISQQKVQAEQSLTSLRQLTDIGKLITASLSAETIVRTVYKNVYELMSADVFAIGIFNPPNNALDFIGRHTAGAPMPPVSFRLDGPPRLSIRSFIHREEIIIQDYEKEFGTYFQEIQPSQVGEQVAQSIVYLPLIAHEKSQGVITVQSFQKNAYPPYYLEILRNLAAYTAIALENADAYRRLEEVNDELSSAHGQLVQSEKLASLGRVMAGIAHEINNPLNFVFGGVIGLEKNLTALLEIEDKFEELNLVIHDGYLRDNVMSILEQTEQLKEKYNYEEVISDLHILMRDIKEGASRAAEIVKNLRNFSRISQDDFYPGDLHKEIDFSLTMLRYKMENLIKIVRNYDEKMPIILSNHGRLNQVFTNILENAIHAMVGAGTITITTQVKEAHILITFKDTGQGMSEAVKAKIFEPFFTTKEVGKGTGLGLAVSFGIIQDLKGSIQVHSAPQKGAEFVITLPKITLNG